MRIGIIDFINIYPLTFAIEEFSPSSVHYTYATPSSLNSMLRNNHLDASFISSYEWLTHKDQFTLLPEFGIASQNQVKSVCLYTKIPPSEFTPKHLVGLTSQSSTSVNLLKLLFQKRWETTPTYEPIIRMDHLQKYSGYLLIGDQCLTHTPEKEYTCYDLAKEWKEWTGHPFIFGVFAHRNSLSVEQKISLSQFRSALRHSYDWGKINQNKIINAASRKTQIPKTQLQSYYNACLKFTIEEKELQGLSHFEELLQSLSRENSLAKKNR